MPTPIFQLCLTLQLIWVQSFHMVNIDVAAGVSVPPPDTQLVNMQVQIVP